MLGDNTSCSSRSGIDSCSITIVDNTTADTTPMINIVNLTP